jgi:hypothetical protein
MAKISKVVVDGFKGQHREYRLSGPTLLVGANGAGKSTCLEGLAYVPTGCVPSGKTNDAAAQFFPATGGTVTITDAEGNWLRRGIARHGKTVSRVLESNRADDAGDADMTPWTVNEYVLWARNFMALSATDKRDMVLRICESGQASDEDVLAQIELACTQVLLGPGATAESAAGWLRQYRVREVLGEYMPHGDATLAEKMLTLSEQAHEEMLGARRAKNEADAARSTLEDGILEARARATELGKAQIGHAVIAARLQEIARQNQRQDEAERASRRSWSMCWKV